MESSPTNGEVAVFTETNMDTHIAIGVSPDITVTDFKIRPPNCFDNEHLPQCLAAKNDHIYDGSNATDSLFTNTRENDMICNGYHKRIKGLLGIKPRADLPKTVPGFEKRSKEKKRLADIDKEFDRSKKSPNLVAKEYSGLLTPRNEVKPATAELPKTAPCLKKRCKEKNKLADINQEFDRSKKAPNVADKESSGLLTPRNEVENATTAESLAKTVACFKKRSKEKKRMVGHNKEFDRRKKAQNLAAEECSALLTPRNQVKLATSSCLMAETPIERPQEVIFAKIKDFSNTQVYTLPQFDIRTPPRTLASPLPTYLRPGNSGNKLETTSAVGKRIMTAANKLKIPASKQRSALSFYRFSPSRASSTVMRSIFDISDNDE